MLWSLCSKRPWPSIIAFWVLIYGFLLANDGVNATYNSGVKTSVYTSDPQVTRQTYTTTQHWSQPARVEYQTQTYNHKPGYIANDNDYHTTITNPSRSTTQQWTAYGSSSDSYQIPQHESSYQHHSHQHEPGVQCHHNHQHEQTQLQHQHSRQPQPQPQALYERTQTTQPQHQPLSERTQTSQMGGQTFYPSSGKLQQADNELTEYFTGCPSGYTGQLPYAYDCRRFLNCWKGRGHVQSCSVGTVFNPETLECDRPDKVKCGANLGSPSNSGSSTHTTTTYQQQQQHSSSPTNRAGRYIDAATDNVDVLCPAGSQGLEPHPSDCTKFINCANGNVHIQDCGPGTAFSIPMKVCDFKEKVDCSGRGGGGVPITGYGSRPTSEDNVRQDRDLGISCGPGTYAIYPHPQDCHKFMRCANGRIAVENCPNGQVFSIERGSCHLENEVAQYDRSSYSRGSNYGQSAVTGGNGMVATSTTTTTNTNTGGTNYHPNSEVYAPQDADVGCPQNANGRYPHPYDCTKFVMCTNGVAHVQSCGPGTAWDKVMEVCDFKEKVNCSPSGTVRRQPEISCPPGVEGLYMHPYDWHKYLSCGSGLTHIMDCGPGTVFSVSRKICDLEKNVVNTDRCNNGVYSSDYDYSYSQTNNNRDSKAYGSGNSQWSYTGTAQIQPPQQQPSTHTYTQTHTTTTNTNQRGSGDRWTNMNVLRPQAPTTNWQQVPNTPAITTNVWSGTAINVDQQSPTRTVIYEEGSLQPDRNYNHHIPYSKPLAPIPSSGSSTTATVVYAQPIGSQETSEEVFGSHNLPQPHDPSYPSYNRPHHSPNLNRQNFTRTVTSVSPGNQWVPIVVNPIPQVPVVTHLMPPLEGPGSPVSSTVAGGYPHNSFKRPGEPTPSRTPPTSQRGHTVISHGDVPIAHLVPPNRGDDLGQRPLDESNPTVTTVYVNNFPGLPWPHDTNQLDTVASGSRKVLTIDESNLYGGLQPPLSEGQVTSTPRPINADRRPQIPIPTQATTPLPRVEYPKLSNATIQTFPHQPHYSSPYSEVAHSRNASWSGRKIPQQSAIKPSTRLELSKIPEDRIPTTSHRPSEYVDETTPSQIDPDQLPLKEALQLMLRPYFNRSGTVDDDVAAKAESHIMNLVAPIDTAPEETTTTTTHNPLLHVPSISIPSTTPLHDDVEIILAGEQHSLVTTTTATQPGSHKSATFYDFDHTTVESERSTLAQQGHTHDHDSNWHKHHQHLPSSSKHQNHHKHQHSREFHEKHPHLPNPFDTPLESPSNSAGIDIRSGDLCPFSCGNGKCIAQHEVCNGVNNCGNRLDEENCDHLGYEVRLTGGESSNKGRVEVKILGKWGYVCDDKFGLKDADVLCHELGFKMGAMEVRGSSYYPPSDVNAQYNMDEVECKGNETSLRECDFKGWGIHNCGPDEVVGVVCKVQQLKCPDNYWLCTKSEECIPTAFLCDVTPDCSDGSDESPKVCNAPIEYRLEGGRTKNEGRLEIFYRGEWGTVCDDDFSVKEAQVVCNSLGYYGKAQVAKNIYGPGSGPIWLDQVSCLGNETTLDQCNHWTWGENNCQHTEDVGLKCTAGPKPTTTNRPITLTATSKDAAWHQTQMELEQSELDDLGKYQGLWQRSSKAVHQQKQCGHFKSNLIDEYAHPEERVINGSIAKRGRHPWQATIRTRGRGGISSHWCGAVIISKKLILTAAHCLAGYPKGSYFVRVGDHYANIAEASEIDSNIENWYIHERFREEKHMNNDIAIILLKNALRFNDYVQPICLPEKGAQLEANRKCTISGWGSIKSGTSTPSNILRAAEVPILPDDVCKRREVYGNAMSEGMFCAGHLDENVDACDGDSGGPLVCSDESAETLYGIISWGQHCGYANHPGVYVRVEKYIDWIYEKINLMIAQGKI
ncbi:tequila isoform X2 [Haematobia irritans]|uniref:tequila isoform X2 n=1 Tax=Haematobia irritans TaxID=7368 RepID=UPI003F505FB8